MVQVPLGGRTGGRWMTISFSKNMERSVGSGRRRHGASTMMVWNRRLWRLWRSDGSGTDGGDGRWGQEGATARRVSSPDYGWQWGRASDLAEVGGGENIMVASLHLSSACFCKEPAEGIIWRVKKLFPAESGKYPGGGGKKLSFATWTIVLGTVVLKLSLNLSQNI